MFEKRDVIIMTLGITLAVVFFFGTLYFRSGIF